MPWLPFHSSAAAVFRDIELAAANYPLRHPRKIIRPPIEVPSLGAPEIGMWSGVSGTLRMKKEPTWKCWVVCGHMQNAAVRSTSNYHQHPLAESSQGFNACFNVGRLCLCSGRLGLLSRQSITNVVGNCSRYPQSILHFVI